MVMKRNAMRRNLRQSIIKSLGRYIAIVMIIALGAALFVGLLMTKEDMVATGQVFMDEQNMFDLRLMNSYGWTREHLGEISQFDGIVDAEAVEYMDLIARKGDAEEDSVYRFLTIPETVNRIALRGGRMPQNPQECLAEGFHADDSILGQQVVIQPTNEEDALESVTERTLTIVGYVATPLYLDMNRGTTSVGSGSLAGFFYVPAGVLDMEYIPEINVTLNGAYDIYSDAYNDAMEAAADALEPKLQILADQRLVEVKEEAEESYQEGYEEFLDGLQEYQDKKAEVDQELKDAHQELLDAEEEIADNEELLRDGERQIAAGRITLAESEAVLEESKKTFSDAKADAYKQMAEGNKTLFDNYQTVSKNMREVENGLLQISTGRIELDSGIAQLESGLEQLDSGMEQLQMLIDILDISIEATERALEMRDQLGNIGNLSAVAMPALSVAEIGETEPTESIEETTPPEETQPQETEPVPEVPEDNGPVKDKLEQQLQELYAKREEYAAQMADLKGQREQYGAQLEELYATRAQLDAQEAELKAVQKQLEDGMAEIELGFMQLAASQMQMEQQFAAAQAQIDGGAAQIKAGYAQLDARSQEIAEGWIALEEGRQELADGWKEYEDGKAEAEAEFADAWQELMDGKEELEDARELIDSMTKNDVIILDRNSNVGYNNLDSASDIVQGVSRVFPVFFILIAALVCITTMTRMIDEERTQIGTLKALGYSNREIIAKYLVYSGSGAIIGCGLGVTVGSTIFPMILWEAYKIMLYIQPGIVLTVNWWLCIAVVAVYTTVLLFVTWYCCRKALREEPAELIRPKAPDAGKKILLEYLPFWHKISFLNKVTIRNIFRYRQRLAMMLVGIGGCTALLVTGFGLKDSIVNVVDFQFEDVTLYDLQVYFREEITPGMAADFYEELDETVQTMFYHQSSVELEVDNKVKEIYMISGDQQLSDFIDLHTGEKPLPLPGLDEVVLSVGVADMLGIDVGDPVLIRNSDLQEMELTVSGIYDNHVYNYSIVAPETIEKQLGLPPEQQMAFVMVPEEMDVHALSARLSELKDVMNVTISEDMADMVRNMMDALNLVIVVVVFCAGLLAVTVLYNLTNININERVREIATIKVLGFRAGETGAYVFKENLSLTVAGSLLGLLLGKLLLMFVMTQIKIDMVWFKTVILPPSYLWAILLTLLSALAVDFVFYFKLQKINMAEALKSVE